MESREINFLKKPEIKVSDLEYICNTKDVYVNIFQIILHKELTIYQYPYVTQPEMKSRDLSIRERIFGANTVINFLNEFYGAYFIFGDSIYGTKKVTEIKKLEKIQRYGPEEYNLIIQPLAEERVIKQEDIHKDELSKQFLEMIIKYILHGNPHLEFYKGSIVLKSESHKIKTDKVSVTFSRGFTTSFMETEGGNFLNVSLKNKITPTETILDYMKKNGYGDKKSKEKIKDLLIGKSFYVSYNNGNHIINDIIFDRNPVNQMFNFNGKSISLYNYYKQIYEKEIENKNQPIILVKKKGSNLYFIPEFSYLSGLDEKAIKDYKFMKKLADFTKLNPDDRIDRTNKFLQLFNCNERDPENKDKLSAKERADIYKIEIKPFDKLFKAYYMGKPQLIGESNQKVKINDKIFPVLIKKDMTKWVCFYEESNYEDAEYLLNKLKEASEEYDFTIKDPKWVEMSYKSNAKEWIDTADKYVGNGKNDYDFAVFLLGKNDYIYPQIKKHSLCKSGYISQVIKTKSLEKNEKNVLSFCSKILLQINAKLQGASYKIKLDKKIEEKKLMIIGVDSSHIKGKRTGVAMVSSINDSFTNFYSDEKIIEEENKENLQFPISSFIDKACSAYNNKNKRKPKGIIIYRQGVSLQQKKFLKEEIRQIEETCKTKNLLFYYILVNTKTTYKFFEKGVKSFNNPSSGLLIIDGITSKNYFEFYIQPQNVTQGSATPTCFHVAYGNLDIPEVIPKLTYDLCHIYSNWQGPVRVPNVIKAAEKLSKMTAKYTLGELHPDLKYGQSFL